MTGIYLLNVEELIQGGEESRFETLLSKLDETRRQKVLSAKTQRTKAAELGAGLLLQRAAQDWLEQRTNYGEEYPDSVPCTVLGLFSRLKAPLSLTYRYGEKGKPYFQEIPLFFSLSHSGEYVLCAVSPQEIGADIQKLQPADVLKLGKRFYAESEYLALECCESAKERQRLFFGLWSRKEAYGKLTGEGVAAVLGKDLGSGDPGRNAEWKEISPPEGYAAAVCLKSETQK